MGEGSVSWGTKNGLNVKWDGRYTRLKPKGRWKMGYRGAWTHSWECHGVGVRGCMAGHCRREPGQGRPAQRQEDQGQEERARTRAGGEGGWGLGGRGARHHAGPLTLYSSLPRAAMKR